jgi:peptide deformylase
MTTLTILEYPDPRLRRRARPVPAVNAPRRALIEAMLETMYARGGIGLAATQVGVAERVLVADVSGDRTAPVVLVNPQILSREVPGMCEESCLSLPGLVDAVPRALRLHVRALDRDGRAIELRAEGLLAACIQHEVDHLDGKLFVDRLPLLRRLAARVRLWRAQRPSAPPNAGAPLPGG